jgi:hypothetical protein
MDEIEMMDGPMDGKKVLIKKDINTYEIPADNMPDGIHLYTRGEKDTFKFFYKGVKKNG